MKQTKMLHNMMNNFKAFEELVTLTINGIKK